MLLLLLLLPPQPFDFSVVVLLPRCAGGGGDGFQVVREKKSFFPMSSLKRKKTQDVRWYLRNRGLFWVSYTLVLHAWILSSLIDRYRPQLDPNKIIKNLTLKNILTF